MNSTLDLSTLLPEYAPYFTSKFPQMIVASMPSDKLVRLFNTIVNDQPAYLKRHESVRELAEAAVTKLDEQATNFELEPTDFQTFTGCVPRYNQLKKHKFSNPRERPQPPTLAEYSRLKKISERGTLERKLAPREDRKPAFVEKPEAFVEQPDPTLLETIYSIFTRCCRRSRKAV